MLLCSRFFSSSLFPLLPLLTLKDSTHADIDLAYLIFVSTLSFLFALGYLVMGVFIWFGPVQHSSSVALKRYLGAMVPLPLLLLYPFSFSSLLSLPPQTIAIVSTFSIFFTVRSTLMVLAAVNDMVIPVLAFAFLELLPASVLCFYILPPEIAFMAFLKLSNTPKITTTTLGTGRSTIKCIPPLSSQISSSLCCHLKFPSPLSPFSPSFSSHPSAMGSNSTGPSATPSAYHSTNSATASVTTSVHSDPLSAMAPSMSSQSG